ncbi:Rha family transcriptional regulator [Pannonibacter phragmitetus]|uniref:Rha family transcriptional regulator n=1 Tax=Pannonibacter phragmitetus TaxID=121719 RepID=UPI00067BADB3|nr:Rha family transcriptional regulator [Pannonibacter phragmitetus]
MTSAVSIIRHVSDYLTEYEKDVMNQPHMTSMEIADLVGKPHRAVMHEITSMLIDLYGLRDNMPFEEVYSYGPRDTVYPCYALPKREVVILSSGYSAAQLLAIRKRWAEIEAEAEAGTEDQAA